MLQLTLAGLVLQGVITLDEAEYLTRTMGRRSVPKTVTECIEQIQAVQTMYRETEHGKRD